MQIGRGEYRSWQMALPCVPLDCALYSVPSISSSCEPLKASLTSVHQGLVPSVDTIYAAKEQTFGCSMVLTLILLHGFQYGSLCSAQYVWICPSAEKNSTSTCENIFLATGSSLERVSMMQTDSQEFFAALQQMRAHCSWLKSDRCS